MTSEPKPEVLEIEKEAPVDLPPAWVKELRKPFDDKASGKLFKAYDKDESKRRPKANCGICGSYHTTAPGVHLDYVGHGAVTDRLLTVDPYWSWEPLAFDEHGLPRFMRAAAGNPLGLWIKLTIKGVTRLGYGSVEGNAFEPEKQLIGDAIRNAAMRFGVALDLWTKEKLESQIEEEPSPQSTAEQRAFAAKANAAPTKKERDEEARKAEDRSDLIREADEAFGPPLEVQTLSGLPVHRTWASLKGEKIGKQAAEYGPGIPSAKLVFAKTWEWASEGSPDGERAHWLEALIARARERHAANPTEPLHVSQQAALHAYSKMQERVSPPPKGDEATCPVSAEEV